MIYIYSRTNLSVCMQKNKRKKKKKKKKKKKDHSQIPKNYKCSVRAVSSFSYVCGLGACCHAEVGIRETMNKEM